MDTNGTYHCVQYTVEPSLVDTDGTHHCVQYTVEPSLVDTDGTHHCVQYTVEPSLVDTDGSYHCVQYSEASLSQGLLMYTACFNQIQYTCTCVAVTGRKGTLFLALFDHFWYFTWL